MKIVQPVGTQGKGCVSEGGLLVRNDLPVQAQQGDRIESMHSLCKNQAENCIQPNPPDLVAGTVELRVNRRQPAATEI